VADSGPVEEFRDRALSGAVFEHVRLRDARFTDVDLRGIVVRDAWLMGADLDGEITGLRVKGVEVEPLVEAELDRRYPERPLMRPTDPAGFREAWDVLELLWAETVERARALPPEMLHERVNGEWSFVETLRHLLFATDSWVRRALLGDPAPWHPLDLSFDQMPETPVRFVADARPSLDEVLALRADRRATVRKVFEDLTDEALEGRTTPVVEPGYPESESFPVREILLTILNEEFMHRVYAERDLSALSTNAR